MSIKAIYVNLPVKDVAKARAFWTSLGFTFNENFSDDKAICLVLQENTIYAMLITHDFFSTFTNKPISEGLTTQVLLAIAVERKEQVDEMVKTALDNGATRYKQAVDHGWMYYDSFADPDGHQWEVSSYLLVRSSKEHKENTESTLRLFNGINPLRSLRRPSRSFARNKPSHRAQIFASFIGTSQFYFAT